MLGAEYLFDSYAKLKQAINHGHFFWSDNRRLVYQHTYVFAFQVIEVNGHLVGRRQHGRHHFFDGGFMAAGRLGKVIAGDEQAA
jgi:hypothetical protein